MPKLLDVYIAGATEKDENARKETPFLESYTSEEETSTVLKALHNEYENNLNSLGINSEATILAGLNYAHLLYNANYLISAERLITKLVTISHRVNGSDHKTTMRANKLLGHCAVWCVVLLL